jgi:hypothetical protein
MEGITRQAKDATGRPRARATAPLNRSGHMFGLLLSHGARWVKIQEDDAPDQAR